MLVCLKIQSYCSYKVIKAAHGHSGPNKIPSHCSYEVIKAAHGHSVPNKILSHCSYEVIKAAHGHSGPNRGHQRPVVSSRVPENKEEVTF